MDSYYIGVGNDRLNVDSWQIPTKIGNSSIRAYHLRTFRDHCIPYEYRRVFLSESDTVYCKLFHFFYLIISSVKNVGPKIIWDLGHVFRNLRLWHDDTQNLTEFILNHSDQFLTHILKNSSDFWASKLLIAIIKKIK